MSYNLADKPAAERDVAEAEKARLFELWQNNLQRAKADAARLFAEKSKRKGKWEEWLRGQLGELSPPEYASMVQREVRKLAVPR
ncbi:hypothetical protein ACSX1C_10300 [Pseudomonas sp. MBLB4123]|uniref:hypothetical protein n=1 Tax=Pseudomonas sp. MBLB4123 TaxID=3451557 RepID=UPI003F7565B8